jgi:hypothetical protein
MPAGTGAPGRAAKGESLVVLVVLNDLLNPKVFLVAIHFTFTNLPLGSLAGIETAFDQTFVVEDPKFLHPHSLLTPETQPVSW